MSPRLALVKQDEKVIHYYLQAKNVGSRQGLPNDFDLDSERPTSIYFSLDSDPKVFIRLTFSPFPSEYCKFVYHYYTIYASSQDKSSPNTSTERRFEIAESVQRTYDRIGFSQPKYPFRFGEDEVRNVPFSSLDWPPAAGTNSRNDGNGMSSGPGPLELSIPGGTIDISKVQESYSNAYACGLLQSRWIPTGFLSENGNFHPLCLPNRQDSLRAAMLDNSKIASIISDINDIMSPVSKSWTIETEKKKVTADELPKIIRLVMEEEPERTDTSPSPEDTLVDLIARFRARAVTLRSQKTYCQQAQRLSKFIEISLIQVREYIRGDGKVASKAANAAMASTMPGSNDWQKKSRKFCLTWHHMFAEIAWGGREIPLYLLLYSNKLRENFTRFNPAFFAELAHALRSTDNLHQPPDTGLWQEIPAVLDLLKKILNGRVEETVVHQALGYPIIDSGRKRQRQRSLDNDKSTNASGDHAKHRKTVTTPPVPISDVTAPLADSRPPSAAEPWSEKVQINSLPDQASPLVGLDTPIDLDPWSEREETDLQHRATRFDDFASPSSSNVAPFDDNWFDTSGPTPSLQQTLLEFPERPEFRLRA